MRRTTARVSLFWGSHGRGEFTICRCVAYHRAELPRGPVPVSGTQEISEGAADGLREQAPLRT